MDFKTASELAIKNSVNLSPGEKIAITSIRIYPGGDGYQRWLDNGDIISFENPLFRGYNAEFSIKNKPYIKIWFSQLSNFCVMGDLETPIKDEIIFKGEPAEFISELFSSATQFWQAVRDKDFRVEIIDTGYFIHREYVFPNYINSISDKFKYILNEVRNGNEKAVSKSLKAKKIYRLIEI